MEQAARIAVVGSLAAGCAEPLRRLPLAPTVQTFGSLFLQATELLQFQPDCLLLDLADHGTEALGGLRLLRQLCPGLAVVLVGEAAQEAALAPLAALCGAALLLLPARPGELAAALEQAQLAGSSRPRQEAFVDLARGIADEINNPLQTTSGHLQLLRASLPPQQQRELAAQLDAANHGLQRIAAAVDRLRLAALAADGPRQAASVDLLPLFASTAPAPGQPQLHCHVHGDREQLAAAAEALQRLCAGLAGPELSSELRLAVMGHHLRLRLLLRGPALQGWRLPQSFEPYYPSRVLRGPGFGLDLFVVQAVVLGHQGQAAARRTKDGALQLDFLLPLAAPPAD